MRQARLILVTGLPGTGKSTLARELAGRYHVPLICKDTIKEPLLDVMGASDRAESRRLSDASFAVMFSLARECLSAGTDLVLEGNFRPGEHERAVREASLRVSGGEPKIGPKIDPEIGREIAPTITPEIGPKIAQLLCQTSEPVRIARLKARASDTSRHAAHRDADLAVVAARELASESSLAAPSRGLDFLDLPGERLVFDSDVQSRADVDTEQVKALLQRLDRWYL